MSVTPNYVPREYKTITAMLTVKDAVRATQFYNGAFGAEVTMVLKDPDGTIVHAEMKIADTIFMLREESEYSKSPETLGGTGVTLQIFVGDVEGFMEDALNAGAEEILPVKKQFYGDRAGLIRDPFGHEWIIATHMEDIPAEEMQSRFNSLYS